MGTSGRSSRKLLPFFSSKCVRRNSGNVPSRARREASALRRSRVLSRRGELNRPSQVLHHARYQLQYAARFRNETTNAARLYLQPAVAAVLANFWSFTIASRGPGLDRMRSMGSRCDAALITSTKPSEISVRSIWSAFADEASQRLQCRLRRPPRCSRTAKRCLHPRVAPPPFNASSI
jgi:hypothetical protein